MKHLYSITINMYFEAMELAKKNGKKPGENFETELMQVLKKNDVKSIGATELTTDELVKEYASHDKKVLNIKVDKEGNTKFNITKLDK